jgi:hypothetical protein
MDGSEVDGLVLERACLGRGQRTELDESGAAIVLKPLPGASSADDAGEGAALRRLAVRLRELGVSCALLATPMLLCLFAGIVIRGWWDH